MGRWKQLGAVAVGGVLLIAAGGGAAWAWVEWTVTDLTTRPHDVHAGDFPIPFPLTAEELAAVDPQADVDALARERAAARGKHLVESRYACIECHGVDFGGGKMVDDPMLGTLMGPNLTLGKGSVTTAYTAKDWDRKVRHGVRPDRAAGFMPSEDYQLMSDRELSDIVTYIRSSPPVDRPTVPIRYGPLGKVLVATGQIVFAADRLEQTSAHAVEAPAEEPTAEFGRHLAGICTGCHRPGFEGGPMPGSPPDWTAPANITLHEQGLAGWTYDDFAKTMRSGITKSGAPVRLPMVMIVPYTARMNDTEMQALWAYLQTVPPKADGT